jgi:hypothetical protein
MADWKDIAGVVGKTAPLLGTLLGGPAGAAVGGIIASVLGTGANADDVSAALANPETAGKLRQIEAERQEKLAELAADQAKAEIAGSVAALQAVNQTMQAEAASEHWPTYTWRPFIGFVTGTMAFGVYFVLPLAHIPVPAVPESVWLMLGGILGVASWFRGKAQADPRIPTDNRG